MRLSELQSKWRFAILACVVSINLITFCTAAAIAGEEAIFRRIPGNLLSVASNGTILTTSSLLSPNGNHQPLSISGSHVRLTAFSQDAEILAGIRVLPGSDSYQSWYRSSNGEVIDIGMLADDPQLPRSTTIIRGSSANGKVLAGTSRNAEDMLQGFYWTSAGGIIPIEHVPNARSASVSGISANGSTIVGTSIVACPECDTSGIIVDCASDCNSIVATYREAFIWTEESGPITLGTLRDPPEPITIEATSGEGVPVTLSLGPSTPQSTHALGVSGDGSTVFGYAVGHGPSQGFTWSADTGIQPLPGLTGNNGMFFPLDATADGSVVVGGIGGSCGTNCFSGPGAVIWDELNGTRLLKSVLINQYGLGEEIGDLFLEHATYISADRRTIAGRVDRTQGGGTWIVRLPVPEPATILSALMLLSVAACKRHREGC